MLNLLRPLVEADAALKGRQALNTLLFAQARNKVFWGFFFGCISFAYLVALASVVAAERSGHSGWIFGGSAIALLVAVACEYLRYNSTFLYRTVRAVRVLQIRVRARTRLDFLFPHAWLAYALVLAPTLVSTLLLAIYASATTMPAATEYKAYSDTLKQLITLAASLLAVQIALFNFMFGQLLGKYSSTIAVSISQHRVVRLLRLNSVFLTAELYLFYLIGFPAVLPKVGPLLALSLLASLLITVWVSNTGINIDRAILYCGHHSAERLASSIKAPILRITGFWRWMASWGLDWRSPERMVVTLAPEHAATKATAVSAGLFNAAHKSIQENQHETFWSTLQALFLVVSAYVEKRKHYLGSSDQFLEYLNNQLAAVVKAAAKSPNEYMVMNVVTNIGNIGALALELGRTPNSPEAPYPQSNPNFGNWQGLLSECFDQTHVLMRSTAASEALTQLAKLTKRSVELGYGEDAALGFPPAVGRIYLQCLAIRDPYHLRLAGESVAAMMDVWQYCLSRRKAVFAGATEPICNAVKNMALAFQAVEKIGSFDLKDPVTLLTSKLSEDQATLQDIALLTLTRPVDERWQRVLAVRDLEHLLDAVAELAQDAATKDTSFAQNYAVALYELAVLILIGLPSQWNEPEEPPDRRFKIERQNVQEQFEAKLATVVKDAFPVFVQARRINGDWEQEFFSIIGIAANLYAETGRESARLLAEDAISTYRELLDEDLKKDKRSIRDDAWDYLQLASVWTRHLLKNDALADRLVSDVAEGRPYIFGMTGLSGGKQGWGSYGYPNVSLLNSDFCLSNPRNIAARLREPVWQLFRRWQNNLMNPDDLHDTYERVEKIREPIRKRLLEQDRARAKAKAARPRTDTEKGTS